MSLKPYTKAFANVWEALSRTDEGWEYLFTNEKIALTLTILSMMETAYDEAFAACEEQDSGFAGTTSWTNNNPYRKDPDVLDTITKLQRNL